MFCGSYTMQRYDCSGVVGSLWRDKDWKKERDRSCAVHMNMLDECITLSEAEVQGLINLQTHPENVRKSKSPLHPDAHMEYI